MTISTPKTYQVGGAVRDALLGSSVNDVDYVVVGGTPEAMLAAGFSPVGKDFPVFLHPETHEEYALARTERKVGQGYTGFAVHYAPDVTLEDDLARRDLTINAMAREVLPNGALGELVDPYQGEADLTNKVLRHVSPAFCEDPVRILRVARFAARWADFTVAPETMTLMKQMVSSGETAALVPERIWQEIARGLMENKPSRMIEVLRECGLLREWLPEVDALFGVPQRADYHPEIDTGIHVMMVLDMSARMNLSLESRYAALCHDLGKGNTPADILPRHTGHEARGVPLTQALSTRIRAPRACTDLAKMVALDHTTFYYLPELTAGTVIDVFKRTDALRRPERFQDMLLCTQADTRGRGGDYPNHPTPWFEAWKTLLARVLDMDIQPLVTQWQNEPAKIPAVLHQARCEAIAPILLEWQNSQKNAMPSA
ncbi:multifunctional CCA addition/repair protein [Hydromonas duriensis]|uniref:Multifunctional CCA protein n=1 Tax=Hydromonas duriensis TaxID=1527608 RepID=A0A4R6YBU2_9BURK|nr:multifunctional CCA addition/repair protein [Hydromonas duriensis]TDR33079.1 metal dependent phosphohydrolase [Hydromonas duriensis]